MEEADKRAAFVSPLPEGQGTGCTSYFVPIP